MDIAHQVGERIKASRLARGWDRVRLAKEAGCTERAIESWEQGQRSPTIQTLAAVAEALGVTRGHLAGDPVSRFVRETG